MILQLSKHTKIGLGATAFIAVVLALLLSVNAGLLFLSLLLTYFTFSNLLHRRLFDSKLFLSIVVIFLYVAVLQVVILLSWLFNHNAPLDWSILTTLIVLVGASAWKAVCEKRLPTEKKRTVGSITFVSRTDILSALIALFFVAIIVIPPLKDAPALKSKDFIPSVAGDFINMGTDDSNHMGMLADHLLLNRGVLYKTNVTEQAAVAAAISSYPPSWHSANAIIIKSFSPSVKEGGGILIAYTISKLFWFFVLVFCFIKVILNLYRVLFTGTKSTLPSYIWLIGAGGFLAYYILLEQFREGFYSFIPELITILLLLLTLTQFVFDKRDLQTYKRYRVLAPATLFAASGVLSWSLVLPALFIAIVLCLLSSITIATLKKEVKSLLQAVVHNAPFVLVAVAAMLLQLYLLTTGSSRSFSEGINETGAITFHSDWYYLFVAVGLITTVAVAAREQLNILSNGSYLLLSLLGLALMIYLFQMITAGHTEYYYFKTLNTAMIVAAPLAVLGWLLLFYRSFESMPKSLNTAAISLAAVVALPLTIGVEPTNTSNVNYVKGNRTFISSENEDIFNLITERGEQRSKGQPVPDYIVFVPHQYAYNLIGTVTFKSTSRISPCNEVAFNIMLQDNIDDMFSALKKCPAQTQKLVILTKRSYISEFTQQIQKNNLDRHVTVQVIE